MSFCNYARAVRKVLEQLKPERRQGQVLLRRSQQVPQSRDALLAKAQDRVRADGLAAEPAEDLLELIEQLSEQMRLAAENLQFELAARLRDELTDLKKEFRQMREAGHA